MESVKQPIDGELLVQRFSQRPTEELRNAILAHFLPTIERVARKFSGLEQFEDLVQVGSIGLLNALNKFDPEAGVRFNTYATHLITGEIKHYLRDRCQMIRHPAWLQELRHKVNRTVIRLQAENNRQPTLDEIARACEVGISSVEEVLATADSLKVASFDATMPGDEDSNELDNLPGDESDQVAVEDRVLLEHAISQLRELEQEVLTRFHFASMSQTDIAKELGISCNYVSHILRQSLTKLRRILINEENSDRRLKRQKSISIEEEVMEEQSGVYSEAFFRQRLQEVCHRSLSDDQPCSLLLIQLKGCEKLAGYYGPEAVNDFVTELGQFLRQEVRRLDMVCRYGETGFAIILPYTGTQVCLVENRLEQRLHQYFQNRRGPNGAMAANLSHAVFAPEVKQANLLLEIAERRLSDQGEAQKAA